VPPPPPLEVAESPEPPPVRIPVVESAEQPTFRIPVVESAEQPTFHVAVAESAEQPPVHAPIPESAERLPQGVPENRARSTLGRGAPAGRGHRKPIPAALRRAALARANYRCERCGATTGLQVDHIQPVCDGGVELGNLQILCRSCHAHKHAPDYAADPRYIGARAAGIARQKRGHNEDRAPDG